ncbi:protein of unknown function [Pararobbsia alpina]
MLQQHLATGATLCCRMADSRTENEGQRLETLAAQTSILVSRVLLACPYVPECAASGCAA